MVLETDWHPEVSIFLSLPSLQVLWKSQSYQGCEVGHMNRWESIPNTSALDAHCTMQGSQVQPSNYHCMQIEPFIIGSCTQTYNSCTKTTKVWLVRIFGLCLWIMGSIQIQKHLRAHHLGCISVLMLLQHQWDLEHAMLFVEVVLSMCLKNFCNKDNSWSVYAQYARSTIDTRDGIGDVRNF